MKKTMHLMLEMVIDIDGKIQTDEWYSEKVIDALNTHFPCLICDDEDADCLLFVDSWEYKNAQS